MTQKAGPRELALRALREAAKWAVPETARPRRAHKIVEGLKEAVAVAKGEAAPARVTTLLVTPKPDGRADVQRPGSRGPAPSSGGRPRKGETAATLARSKPWEAEGISQATWYRRQKAKP